MKPYNLLFFCLRCTLLGLLLCATVKSSASAAHLSYNSVPHLAPHPVPQVSTPIQHIVYMLKENRTFDNYFGLFPGVDGTTTGLINVNGKQQSIPLNILTNNSTSFCHSFRCAVTAEDHGAMDSFNLPKLCSQPPYPCYAEAQQSLIPNYWSLAQNYVLDDRAFASLNGPSFPNHLFAMAGASGPDLEHSAINNPSGGLPWGCDAPSTVSVQLYNKSLISPCFSYSTLADEMTTAGVSWRYYAPVQGESGYIWNTPDDFSQERFTSEWQNDVPWQQFTTDAASGQLPAFSWLVSPAGYSDHPPANTCKGENWTSNAISAIMNGPDWASTVIVLTWDDWGGFYDHVPPQNIDALGYGFRVPFLVISPYAYAGDNSINPHISHDQVEFSSVLRLAEDVFGLPSLGTRDATAGNLLNLLDFSQVHNPTIALSQRVCPKDTQSTDLGPIDD